ncbi:hypothetical protein AABB24_035415 [Solanum stoloniferum]|uniref:FRIGIDA-like protein n=1 Tax=Solanum stoloniferum TaxID=62892 RepID=A0ABD2R7E6_9SOLN
MDLKELIPYLKDKLKRNVEIIPPKKDDGGGEKKEGGGDKKVESNEKKEGESKAEGSKGVETKSEANKLEYYGYNAQTHYAMPMYNQSYMNQDYGVTMYDPGYNAHTGYAMEYGYHQPSYVPPPPPTTYLNNAQMFSDENPNGCSVM